LQTSYISASSNFGARYPQNVYGGTDSLSAPDAHASPPVTCRVGDDVYFRSEAAMLTQQVLVVVVVAAVRGCTCESRIGHSTVVRSDSLSYKLVHDLLYSGSFLRNASDCFGFLFCRFHVVLWPFFFGQFLVLLWYHRPHRAYITFKYVLCCRIFSASVACFVFPSVIVRVSQYKH